MSYIREIRQQAVEDAQENRSWYGEPASAPRIYAYVQNDPLNEVDPLGLATIYGVPSGAVLYSLNGQTFYAPPNANFQTAFNTGTGGGSLNEIHKAVAQGGMFDYQRDSSGNFYPAYITAANLAVGYYMAGAGYSSTTTYILGELYASIYSSNYLSSYLSGGGNADYWTQAVSAANSGVFPAPVTTNISLLGSAGNSLLQQPK